jgi:outer membrane protein
MIALPIQNSKLLSMKNGLLIYNILLTLVVGYLFYRVMQCEKGCVSTSSEILTPATGSAIVYVNTDSLLANYTFFKNLKEKLTKKQDSIDVQLKNRGRDLEGEITNYQKRGATMTEQQRAEEEERLGRKQQQLVQYRQTIIDQLSKEEDDLQDSVHNHLVSYLRELNKTKNYQFILGYQRGSGILLANDSLDITKIVTEGINEK